MYFQDSVRQKLEKRGYHLFAHGAVKPCMWLRRSLRGGDQCYKHQFYGIASHQCIQMTPTLICNHRCLHCWRPMEDVVADQGGGWIEPSELLDGIMGEQQRLISGYGGSEVTDHERLEEARHPAHVAISLIGEPTLYPMLDELIREIKRRKMTSFLVSNATQPDVVNRVEPTQLYLSLNAPDERTYKRICNPDVCNWNRIQESFEELGNSSSRTVVRITLAKGVNLFDPGGYARLIKLAEPDFVEVKAYMHLGSSRNRLTRDAMPEHAEVVRFAQDLSGIMDYSYADEVPMSRVALLSKNEDDKKRFLKYRG